MLKQLALRGLLPLACLWLLTGIAAACSPNLFASALPAAEYALNDAKASRARQAPRAALPPVTVALADRTFALGSVHRQQPFNATNRYEMPLKDGLVFVLLDTPSLGHASYIVERRKPGVYGTPLPLVDYAITITDPRYGFTNTQTVTGHGQWQRWRVQNKRWPFVGITEPELVFNVDPRLKPPPLKEVPEVTPLFTGGMTKAMGTTGLRADIGVYTGWLARAIRTGDFASALRNTEAAASIPWHVRDDRGRMVFLIGRENLRRQMRTYYGTHSKPEDTIDENTSWSMDTSHMPKAAWAGYVVNSKNPDPYMIEELQFEAAAAINQGAHTIGRGPDGLFIHRGQGRDYAWGMVSLVHALRATPEAVPNWLLSRAQLARVVQANLAMGLELTKQPHFDKLSVTVGKFKGSRKPGEIRTQTNVVDYIPLAMMHCYRLTGDRRFITIGLAHLDGRIAKRFRASPKYAALYPPVAIGTGGGYRIFDTWKEAYRAYGRVSDESTPWAKFTLPTGAETDDKGKRIMAYHSETIPQMMVLGELYRAHGFTTPDIDWMVAFLNKQRGGARYSTKEQFAVAK